MQFSNHVDRERAAAIQDFGHTRSAPEVRLQVSPREPAALHVVEQCIDRISLPTKRCLDHIVNGRVSLSHPLEQTAAHGMTRKSRKGLPARSFRPDP